MCIKSSQNNQEDDGNLKQHLQVPSSISIFFFHQSYRNILEYLIMYNLKQTHFQTSLQIQLHCNNENSLHSKNWQYKFEKIFMSINEWFAFYTFYGFIQFFPFLHAKFYCDGKTNSLSPWTNCHLFKVILFAALPTWLLQALLLLNKMICYPWIYKINDWKFAEGIIINCAATNSHSLQPSESLTIWP